MNTLYKNTFWTGRRIQDIDMETSDELEGTNIQHHARCVGCSVSISYKP